MIALVNIDKQQAQQQEEERLHDNDILLPPSPKLAYRDADYETDGGVAATRPRAVRAAVDMQRSTGRGLTLAEAGAEGGRRYGDFSDGGEGERKRWKTRGREEEKNARFFSHPPIKIVSDAVERQRQTGFCTAAAGNVRHGSMRCNTETRARWGFQRKRIAAFARNARELLLLWAPRGTTILSFAAKGQATRKRARGLPLVDDALL